MSRKRTWSDADLIKSVSDNLSIRATAKQLGLCVAGSIYPFLRKHIKRLNIDNSHWLGTRTNSGIRHKGGTAPMSESIVFSKGEWRTHMRDHVNRANFLEYICNLCQLTPEWNGKPLVLQLDHIDCDNTNNLKENLRWLCPNCHTQTPTFCSRKG